MAIVLYQEQLRKYSMPLLPWTFDFERFQLIKAMQEASQAAVYENLIESQEIGKKDYLNAREKTSQRQNSHPSSGEKGHTAKLRLLHQMKLRFKMILGIK